MPALGAGRRRLLAQFVAEGLVLLVLGGALGLVVAWTGVRALTVAYPESVPRVADIGIDPAVLGFTLLVSAVTGVVFGLAPLRYLSERVGGRLLNDRTRRHDGQPGRGYAARWSPVKWRSRWCWWRVRG